MKTRNVMARSCRPEQGQEPKQWQTSPRGT